MDVALNLPTEEYSISPKVNLQRSQLRFDFKAPWTIFAVGIPAARGLHRAIGHTYRVPAIGDHFHFGFEMGRIARSLVDGPRLRKPVQWRERGDGVGASAVSAADGAGFQAVRRVHGARGVFFCWWSTVLFSAAIAPAVYEIGGALLRCTGPRAARFAKACGACRFMVGVAMGHVPRGAAICNPLAVGDVRVGVPVNLGDCVCAATCGASAN